MLRTLTSVTVSASGHVSASSGEEDNRRVRVSAGNGLDNVFLAWVKAKAEAKGLSIKVIPNRSNGQTLLFIGKDDKDREAQAELVIDFGTFLSNARDSEYNGTLQRTYWLGAPRISVNLGAFGE